MSDAAASSHVRTVGCTARPGSLIKRDCCADHQGRFPPSHEPSEADTSGEVGRIRSASGPTLSWPENGWTDHNPARSHQNSGHATSVRRTTRPGTDNCCAIPDQCAGPSPPSIRAIRSRTLPGTMPRLGEHSAVAGDRPCRSSLRRWVQMSTSSRKNDRLRLISSRVRRCEVSNPLSGRPVEELSSECQFRNRLKPPRMSLSTWPR